MASLEFTGPRLGRYRNAEAAVAEYGELANIYARAMLESDALADAFADDCALIGRGRAMAMLDRVLSEDIPVDDIPDAPDSLRALIAQISDTPQWVDFDKIDLGAAAYSRHAREAGIALGTSSLVSGYHNYAAARPLIITGRFGGNQARLRSYETSKWTFTASRPGGMHRNGQGFIRTVRVRMIHAFVRRHIQTRLQWDDQELGIPINQADLSFTVIEFSLMPIRAMQQLGVHFTDAELEGMYMLWRYMGYLIGVNENVLITSQASAERIEALAHFTSPGPDDDCRAYVDSLLDDVLAVDLKRASGVLGIVGKHRGHALLHGLARDFVGKEIADDLGIDDTVWKHLPKLTTPALNAASRLAAFMPSWQERTMNKNLAEVDFILDETAQQLGVTHDLVDASPQGSHPANS